MFIDQDSAVELYNCLFSNCSSYYNGVAAYIAAEKIEYDKTDPNNFDNPLQKLNATYCCFQQCFFKNAGKYGTAMYISANLQHHLQTLKKTSKSKTATTSTIQSADNPSLIHIRTYSVNITNFCFLRTSYEGTMEHNKFKIIGINDGYDHRTNKNMLFNCFYDFESDAIVSMKFPLVDSVNINDLDNRPNQPIETFLISQLNL